MALLLSSPAHVTGVIVYVNEDSGYGYLNAAYFGRVLIHKYFNKEMKVGSWFSLYIHENRDLTLVLFF